MIEPGTRVRLRPRAGGDVWDTLLAGRTARVERVEEDLEGRFHVAVALDDDPGRDLGPARPGGRYFFAPEELEQVPCTSAPAPAKPAPSLLAGSVEPTSARVLVAGIGNVFLGDDGFGCAVAAALADAPLPDGVEVHDFGVRGLDLAYALASYDAAVLVDAMPLGDEPGTVALIEPQLDAGEAAEIETHGMDPARVLRLARELGGLPRRTLVVGCEPQTVVDPEGGEVLVELSEPVRKAVEEAVALARSVLEELVNEESTTTKGGR